MTRSSPILTVWRIDVEPDEHSPSVGEKPWEGFADMLRRVKKLGDRLGDGTGRVVRPTWLFRMDPDIERCFGRADFVVRRHGDLLDQLNAREDPLGIHVHYYRWDAERAVAFSDHADSAWTINCLRVAAEAFKHAIGRPARLCSHGGYFLTEALLDTAVELGIAIDLTVEPGMWAKAEDLSFGAYATAPSTDFAGYPRHPYYPSRRALSVPCSSRADSRPILIVPLTAFDYRTALTPWHRRIAHRLLDRPRQHLPLSPWREWPSPKVYWDFVARAADEQKVPYFAFATRTDSPASGSYQRVWELLEYLPKHPIAKRLKFVDPLAAEIPVPVTL